MLEAFDGAEGVLGGQDDRLQHITVAEHDGDVVFRDLRLLDAAGVIAAGVDPKGSLVFGYPFVSGGGSCHRRGPRGDCQQASTYRQDVS